MSPSHSSWDDYWRERLVPQAEKARDLGVTAVECAAYFFDAGALVTFFSTREDPSPYPTRFAPVPFSASPEVAYAWLREAAGATDEASKQRAEVEKLMACVHAGGDGWITVAAWPTGDSVRTIAVMRLAGTVSESEVLDALQRADRATEAKKLPRVLRGLLLAAAEATFAREQKWLHQKTFLLNDTARRLAIENLEEFFREGRACAQIFLEIDNFKSMNERLGYSGADAVARRVARALRSDVRDVSRLLFHVSGDEFKLLVWHPSSHARLRQVAAETVEKVAADFKSSRDDIAASLALDARRQDATEVVGNLTLSAGLALLHGTDEIRAEWPPLADDLDGASERGLDAAKKNGKNQAFISEEVLARGGVILAVDGASRLKLSIGYDDGIRVGDVFDVFARPTKADPAPAAAIDAGHPHWIGSVRVFSASARESMAHALEGIPQMFSAGPLLRPRFSERDTRLRRPRGGTGQASEILCALCGEGRDVEIFRSRYARGFGSRYPVVRGHVLIVALRHCERVADLTGEEYAEIVHNARSTAEALRTQLAAQGVDWSIQDGAAAGQDIPHVHLHLLPRTFGDGLDGSEWRRELGRGGRPEASREELRALASSLKEAWR